MRSLLLVVACLAHGASFEVASIKPAAASKGPREGGNRARIEYTPDSLAMRNVSITDCIQWAYRVEYYQFPQMQSLDSTSYDILAKAAGPVSVRELRLMLQQLLADRFKLTLHHETKETPVYELTVAKGGPRLPKPRPVDDHHAVENLPRIQDGSFVFEDNSMAEFAASCRSCTESTGRWWTKPGSRDPSTSFSKAPRPRSDSRTGRRCTR